MEKDEMESSSEDECSIKLVQEFVSNELSAAKSVPEIQRTTQLFRNFLKNAALSDSVSSELLDHVSKIIHGKVDECLQRQKEMDEQARVLMEEKRTEAIEIRHKFALAATAQFNIFHRNLDSLKLKMDGVMRALQRIVSNRYRLHQHGVLTKLPLCISQIYQESQNALHQIILKSFNAFELRIKGLKLLTVKLSDALERLDEAMSTIQKVTKDRARILREYEHHLAKLKEKIGRIHEEIHAIDDQIQRKLELVDQEEKESERLALQIEEAVSTKDSSEKELEELLVEFEDSHLQLDAAREEKNKLRKMLEPFNAALEDLWNETQTTDCRGVLRELQLTGDHLATMISHRNTNQGLMQARQYVVASQELKQENVGLKKEISDLRQEIQAMQIGLDGTMDCSSLQAMMEQGSQESLVSSELGLPPAAASMNVTFVQSNRKL